MRMRGFLEPVATFYSALVTEFGASPKGVDWPSTDRQEIRFEQFERLFGGRQAFSLLDYGCGYGAYLGYLNRKSLSCDYTGFDISESMIAKAAELFERSGAVFSSKLPSGNFDFVVASGIFNVKLDAPSASWEEHVFRTLDDLDILARHGFAFNVLSSRREAHRKMQHLYYANPSEFLERCLKKYSPNVALLHDYDLWDFTVIVRKN
jgi:SAM-dependent methyltransferase